LRDHLLANATQGITRSIPILLEALNHQDKSKEHRLNAMRKHQEQEEIQLKLSDDDRRRQKVELDRLEIVEKEKLNSLIKLAVYKGTEAKQRLDPIQIELRERKRRFEEMRMSSEDRVFEAKQRVREDEIEMIKSRR
jgi:hypothetical protein